MKIKYIGLRPGEKIHEVMITQSDSFNTIDLGKYYAILPSSDECLKLYKNAKSQFKHVENDFSYDSKNNADFLNIEQLRYLIINNVDQTFKPF